MPIRSLLASAGAALALAAPAHAQYPDQPVHLVVNFSAGGPLDIEARLLAQHASKLLGQPVIVENRAGAAGNIGADSVARAAPDGYTLLMTTDSVATVNPFVYRDMPFDPARALHPIGLAGAFSQALVVRPELGVKTVDEFIALAKSRPLSFSTAGNASPGHLTFEMFNQTAGLELTHVPYRGNAQATTDLLGGQVDAGFLAVPGVLQYVKQGKLVALAVSGDQRDPALPDVPTVREAGGSLQSFDARFAFILMSPAGMPDAIAGRWRGVLEKVFAEPSFLQRLDALGIRAPFGDARTATAWIQEHASTWSTVVKHAGITAN